MSNKFYQGRYKVKNPKKYLGDYTKVIFRSGWELKMFIWCDTNSKVLRWSSEEVVIPYISPFDGRYHRYFTDIYYEEYDSNGKIVKRVCEVKPYKQTMPPKKGKRMSKYYESQLKTYIINQEKWKAAAKYCKERDMKFVLITEKELGIK